MYRNICTNSVTYTGAISITHCIAYTITYSCTYCDAISVADAIAVRITYSIAVCIAYPATNFSSYCSTHG